MQQRSGRLRRFNDALMIARRPKRPETSPACFTLQARSVPLIVSDSVTLQFVQVCRFPRTARFHSRKLDGRVQVKHRIDLRLR